MKSDKPSTASAEAAIQADKLAKGDWRPKHQKLDDMKARISTESDIHKNLPSVVNKLTSDGTLDHLHMTFQKLFHNEVNYTLNILTYYLKTNNIQPSEFDLSEQLLDNIYIFKENFKNIMRILIEDIWTSHFSRQEVLFSLIQKYQQEEGKKVASNKGNTANNPKGALKKNGSGFSSTNSSNSAVGIKLIGRNQPSTKGSGNIFEITEVPADEENDAASKRRSVTIMSSKGDDAGRISANRESLTDRVPQEVSSPKSQPVDTENRGSKSVEGHRIKYSDDISLNFKPSAGTNNTSSTSGGSKPFNIPKGVNVNIFAVDKMPRGNSSNFKKRKDVSPLFVNSTQPTAKLGKNKSYANLLQEKGGPGGKTSYTSIRAETLKTPG